MDGIVPKLGYFAKQKLYQRLRRCREAKLKMRYLIVINLANGRSPVETAQVLGVCRSTVYNVARRFREQGELGLLDRREDNGELKLDDGYLGQLYELVASSPLEQGWRRATWTREMLVETMARRTEVGIHVATMSRALAMIGAKRKRPRPVVRCPWSARAKNKRIRAIRGLLANLPRGEVAVYADEVDIHLNPKIGLDWMVRGQQKEVVTPGRNVKRYLAGAMDAATGRLIYVEGERKNSWLFIALLNRLAKAYPHAKVIHVVLDNFRIHDSQITQRAVEGLGGRIVLHFLPPYCPDANRIERLWLDLHANVTRNHCCPDMDELMLQVRRYLRRRSRDAGRRYLSEAA